MYNIKNINLKDRKTQVIIGVVVLLSGIIFYNILKKKPISQVQPLVVTQPQTTLNMELVLKQGSQGSEVEELQRVLINKYGQNLGSFGVNKDGIDGVLGDVTLAGLKKAKGVTQIALKDL